MVSHSNDDLHNSHSINSDQTAPSSQALPMTLTHKYFYHLTGSNLLFC